ncbi:hypothetical protein MCC93_03350 [Morococcus cerebrosus]|uniref:Uncharacterized protein n=1 Tax=Morococcus cerebrosus TaxID=1056807 RepID=A0A0C1H2X8_9NEIS|nr:hypothetical protein MCC93_03350 [Morococcus cerebrosus]
MAVRIHPDRFFSAFVGLDKGLPISVGKRAKNAILTPF